MAKNPDFDRCIEERENESFFKVIQSIDTSSENMRAIPHDFSRNLSDDELSGTMKIRARWGRSWEIGISKNPRFYFMEKAGWEKFVRDNFLGDSELLTFIHKGKMCFNVIIYKQDGKEMVKPPQSMAFLASSSRIRTEQDVVSPDLGLTTAETNGGGNYKRKLNFGKKKNPKESQNSKMTKKAVSARRDSACASSSSVAEFTTFIKNTYLIRLVIPISVKKNHMPEERTTFKIHQPDMKKSWNVVYLSTHSWFSAGWRCLAKEYPIAVGDTCKFTFIKPTELVLVVSKP